jgi:hypothetical protein
MSEAELLLTDEFVAFSKEITSIHEEKKVVEEEFKKIFEEYKLKKKTFETRVSAANTKWEDWKKTQQKKEK